MKSELNDVVILAGGFGSRLKPIIGNDIPKPMALIGNVPLLEHQINLCRKNNFCNILILVHHLADVITNYFQDGREYGVNITYRLENTPRGTAGAIYDNLDLLKNSFIVIYGDTFLDVNLRKFYNSNNLDYDAVTYCHPNSHPYDSDLLKLDSNNFVTDVFRPINSGKQIYKNIVNAALYVMNRSLFSSIDCSKKMIDISSELFPEAIKKGKKIKAYESVEYIKDMGTPDRYEKVKSDFLNHINQNLADSALKKCIFLDRDGVINYDVGHLNNINDFKLIDGVEEAISRLVNQGFLVICVTNQPVISRGELSFDGLEKIHMKMEALLGKKGAYLHKIYFCPHYPESGYIGEVKDLKIKCNCRKPSPGMLLRAIKDFNIDPSSSWMIGDHSRDILAGKAANVSGILIKSDKRTTMTYLEDAEFVAKDLLSATDYILAKK